MASPAPKTARQNSCERAAQKASHCQVFSARYPNFISVGVVEALMIIVKSHTLKKPPELSKVKPNSYT